MEQLNCDKMVLRAHIFEYKLKKVQRWSHFHFCTLYNIKVYYTTLLLHESLNRYNAHSYRSHHEEQRHNDKQRH